MPQQHTTLIEIATAYWPVLACSFAISLVATPICRSIAHRRGIVDRPDDRLKPHKRPVPYLGGVAIFLGWAGGVGLALALFPAGVVVDHRGQATEQGANGEGRRAKSETEDVSSPPQAARHPTGSHDPHGEPFREREGALGARHGPTFDLTMMIGILLAGAAATLLGLFDDLRVMSPKVKLIGLSGVAILLIAFGLGDDTFLLIFKAARLHADMPALLTVACSAPLTVFIVVGACNATNLIDGLDGLCSGVLGILAAGFLALAVHMHLWGDWLSLDAQRVTLSLAMMGAALGFLPYNRNPATIFMGDAGSMLLGLNAAILLLLFAKSSGMRWMLGSLMVFGLPLGDMVLTLARRWRHQRPLMMGDRSHFYDQLVDRGWPVRRVVRVSYAVAAAFAAAGCAAIVVRVRYLVPLYFCLLVAAGYAVHRMRMLRVDETGIEIETSEHRRPKSE